MVATSTKTLIEINNMFFYTHSQVESIWLFVDPIVTK